VKAIDLQHLFIILSLPFISFPAQLAAQPDDWYAGNGNAGTWENPPPPPGPYGGDHEQWSYEYPPGQSAWRPQRNYNQWSGPPDYQAGYGVQQAPGGAAPWDTLPAPHGPGYPEPGYPDVTQGQPVFPGDLPSTFPGQLQPTFPGMEYPDRQIPQWRGENPWHTPGGPGYRPSMPQAWNPRGGDSPYYGGRGQGRAPYYEDPGYWPPSEPDPAHEGMPEWPPAQQEGGAYFVPQPDERYSRQPSPPGYGDPYGYGGPRGAYQDGRENPYSQAPRGGSGLTPPPPPGSYGERQWSPPPQAMPYWPDAQEGADWPPAPQGQNDLTQMPPPEQYGGREQPPPAMPYWQDMQGGAGWPPAQPEPMPEQGFGGREPQPPHGMSEQGAVDRPATMSVE